MQLLFIKSRGEEGSIEIACARQSQGMHLRIYNVEQFINPCFSYWQLLFLTLQPMSLCSHGVGVRHFISVYLSKKVFFLSYANCLHLQRVKGNQVKGPAQHMMCSYSCQFSLTCWGLIFISVHYLLNTHKK